MDVLSNALITINPEKKMMKNKNAILFHKPNPVTIYAPPQFYGG